MFASIISPKGGMPLRHLVKYPFSREANVDYQPKDDAVIVGDFVAITIGYAYKDLKAGEPLFIKPTDGEKLLSLLKKHFGRQ